MMEIGTEITLGSDSVCDDCGSSYNTLYYTYVPVTGVHLLRTSVGCYGGENVTTHDAGEARGFVIKLTGTFPDAVTELNELAEAILALG